MGSTPRVELAGWPDLPSEEYHGTSQPIRRWNRSISARGARDTNTRRVLRSRRYVRWRLAIPSAKEEQDAIAATLHPEVTFTHPLSLSGKRADAVWRQGKDRVLGYLGGAFTLMDRIRFTNQRLSVAAGGETAFVQADGDLTTADGPPYQNVYLFRIDWRGDRIIAIEEYANPLTFCQTFSHPLCRP